MVVLLGDVGEAFDCAQMNRAFRLPMPFACRSGSGLSTIGILSVTSKGMDVGAVAEQLDFTRETLHRCARELILAGRAFHDKGWVPATSGNFSTRLSAGYAAVTASGRDKGALTDEDFVVVDLDGQPLDAARKSSAETLLHTALYRRFPAIGAVLHTHSLNATLLSRRHGSALHLEGYELLKAFPGIDSHDTRLVVPIFANDQDIARLRDQVERYLDAHDGVHGYLIAGHGLYAWGTTVAEATRHLEAFEFLFQCEMHQFGGAVS